MLFHPSQDKLFIEALRNLGLGCLNQDGRLTADTTTIFYIKHLESPDTFKSYDISNRDVRQILQDIHGLNLKTNRWDTESMKICLIMWSIERLLTEKNIIKYKN